MQVRESFNHHRRRLRRNLLWLRGRTNEPEGLGFLLASFSLKPISVPTKFHTALRPMFQSRCPLLSSYCFRKSMTTGLIQHEICLNMSDYRCVQPNPLPRSRPLGLLCSRRISHWQIKGCHGRIDGRVCGREAHGMIRDSFCLEPLL